MSKLQIAWLELGTVGGIGVLLILAGIMMRVFAHKKNQACNAEVKGSVVAYGFPGEGRMYPIVTYTVGGNNYRVRKKFCGVIVKKISGFPIHVQTEAYEDEKGWLHVKIGPIANLRQLAEQLWPLGNEMTVYYNPENPRQSYVEKPFSASMEFTIFMLMGMVTVGISVLVFFLIQL